MIIALVAILLIIVIFIVLGTKSFKLNTEISSNPVSNYHKAETRIEQIQFDEADRVDLNIECGTKLFTHGEKTDNVIVFLHGFTSCPDQFSQLGQEYFERGYNVYIPRVPRHGIKDRLGNPLKGLNCRRTGEICLPIG